MGTKIEWTDETWNPVTGCTKVSEGCRNCYAERMSKRLRGRFGYPADDPFAVTLHPDRLDQPLRWRKPRRVFVCSMGDLFHEDVPDEFIAAVFGVMAACPQHTFQLLTKRPERMAEWFRWLVKADEESWETHGYCVYEARQYSGANIPYPDVTPWPLPNVHPGTSIEDQPTADERIPWLLECPAAVRFVSCEPLLGPVSFRWSKWYEYYPDGWRERGETQNEYDGLRRLSQVIVGGESGPGARPMDLDWARSIRDQCQAAGVPFFFKQVGGRTPKANGRLLDGREWNEMPG